MRVLVDQLTGRTPGTVLDDASLTEVYAVTPASWLRVNMVSSLDGAATGADGRTGSINNPADRRVFALLRATADAVVVGAGTARSERYGPAEVPIVVVSRSGQVPARLQGAPAGRVLLASTAAAPALDRARELLGDEHVLVTGEASVDLPDLLGQLRARGLQRLLSEGGPSLLRDLLAAGAVDELCLTTVPRLVAGEHPRVTTGAPLDVPLRLGLLLEQDGTLLGRWLVEP